MRSLVEPWSRTFLLPTFRRLASDIAARERTPEEGGNLLRTYELVFIAQPDLDEEGLTALVEHVKQTMTDGGAEIVKTEDMGRRKLAYPIARRNEGHYVLMQAKMERPAIIALERDLKLSEDVLRHLLVRTEDEQDEQVADEMKEDA